MIEHTEVLDTELEGKDSSKPPTFGLEGSVDSGASCQGRHRL